MNDIGLVTHVWSPSVVKGFRPKSVTVPLSYFITTIASRVGLLRLPQLKTACSRERHHALRGIVTDATTSLYAVVLFFRSLRLFFLCVPNRGNGGNLTQRLPLGTSNLSVNSHKCRCDPDNSVVSKNKTIVKCNAINPSTAVLQKKLPLSIFK